MFVFLVSRWMRCEGWMADVGVVSGCCFIMDV